MSDYQRDEIEIALPSGQDRELFSKRGRFVRSPELTTVLQHYTNRLDARLDAEDRSDLNQIREQYQAEARRLHEAEKDKAIERSSGQLAMLQSSIAAWRKATENITPTRTRRRQATDSELHRDLIVLDVARAIRRVDETTLTARSSASWNNVAKVASSFPSPIESLGHMAGVEFVFLWTNPNSYAVVLDVESSLALNGFCIAGADGGFIADNTTDLDVSVFLQPFINSNPPVYPPSQPGQSVSIAEITAYGGGFLGLGEVRSLNAGGYYGIYYQNFIVPADSVAVFKVSAFFSAGADSGGFAKADFASGDFQVMCPIVVLRIV